MLQQNDPYELTRIKSSDNPALASRLNALLLVQKTCNQDTCRNPWKALHPDGTVQNLKDALNTTHDSYYASLPQVSFKQCLNFQSPSNEEPFFPGFDASAPYAFAQQYRNVTDALGSAQYPGLDDAVEAIPDTGPYGAVYQDLDVIEQDARPLTDAEIAYGGPGARLKRGMLPYYG